MTPSRITILPDHLANKIAAGEVIERPESVVKELLENSLDAGARTISLTVRDGGTSLIQVADDGCGMDERDATLSFLRHATSKIRSYEDLEAIRTFGFRGEALASVAAVAQVTMKTRRAEDEAATVVRIDGGGAPRVSREAREQGTTVTVQHLFFNVPARRKFLKSPATEFRHLHDAVVRVALGHPSLALTFVSDDETILDLQPTTPENRVLELFGQRFSEGLVPVREETDLLTVHGFVGKPTFGHRTRSHQYLFLNNRFIVSRNISHAVFSAYENLLLKGTFPVFILFLDIDPHRVDVNVHPSKMEAKFDDEQSVHRVVAALVRKGLGGIEMVPVLTPGEGRSSDGTVDLRFTSRQHSWPDEGNDLWSPRNIIDFRTGEILRPSGSDNPTPGGLNDGLLGTGQAAAQVLQHEADRTEATGGALIWQLHKKYILCQIRSGLMIVDQHVAHERILYERALERFEHQVMTAQQLLFPHTVQLSAADYSLLEELLPHFALLGFEIKLFGKNTIVVEGVPPDIKMGNEEKMVGDILALYREYGRHTPADARDLLAKSYSCKAAIKAGDPLTEPEMRSLIDQLFATKMPYVCPHGRPVVLRISTEELDRRFGRI